MKTKRNQKTLELQLLFAVIAVSRTQTPPSSPPQGAGLETSPEHCGIFYGKKQKMEPWWQRTAQLPTSFTAGSAVSLTQKDR